MIPVSRKDKMMERKSLPGGLEIKDADKGIVTAVFSTMNVRDLDGDFTREGAFTDGAKVAISAYGHKSWDGALPVGKGIIRVKGKKAVLEGQFFMNTAHGKDTFETVKALAEEGLGEWSYGFDIEEHSYGKEGDRQVRYLDRVKVHEVSPVLLGAGVGTRTTSVKSRQGADTEPAEAKAGTAVRGPIPARETATLARQWDGAKTVADLPEDARPSQLRTVFAWVDPDGDPELKASYRFAHHHGIDGPANLRACLQGIAKLNGAGDAGIPDADREAVYRHLSAHLLDADRDAPELRDRGSASVKNPTLNEELVTALTLVSGAIESASRVVALRREKGKGLSKVNGEILGWIADDLKSLESLMSLPVEQDEPEGPGEDEKAELFLRSIALANGM
ncbi:HK97 family phage prohead protease [Streptomyces sp. NPDC046925]|uniref:HK97 family phage prohead protease n=1 Tax=Streptomyces sp. NPDC046925 TaxID=3155375 RepID=UPI003400583A